MNKSETDSSPEDRTAVPRKLARLAKVYLAVSEAFHLKERHPGQPVLCSNSDVYAYFSLRLGSKLALAREDRNSG